MFAALLVFVTNLLPLPLSSISFFDDNSLPRTSTGTQTVDMQLASMVETLKSLVDQVNSSSSSSSSFGGGGSGGGGGGGRGDAGSDGNARKIVRILNAHHHSLAWLEESSKRMLLDASEVGRRLGMPSDAALMPP